MRVSRAHLEHLKLSNLKIPDMNPPFLINAPNENKNAA